MLDINKLNHETKVLFGDELTLAGIFLESDGNFSIFIESEKQYLKYKLTEEELNRLIRFANSAKKLREKCK